MRDPRAVAPLAPLLKDADVCQTAANALAQIGGAHASRLLLTALQEKNLLIIAGARRFFMNRGDPASLNALIASLNSFGIGNESMANDFLNSGKPRLEKAAEEWGQRHGYMIGGNGNGRTLFVP